MKTILNWLDDRTGYRKWLHEALYERVPGGPRWRYVWGSTLVFAFVVQLITGFFLWAAYSPNSQGAWESVYYIQHEMQAGWLLRGVHHFMAQAMIVLLALHLMQVIIDGAYKAPREVNFWLGLILMLIVLGLSLTGYLLPWDEKGYWATKVATNIMAETPLVGNEMKAIVVGGPEYGHHTLTRFFALHAGLLPGLLVGFLVLHIYVFRRHGLTAYKPDPKRDSTFWPDQVLRDAVACLGVLVVVLFLVFLPSFQGQPLGAPLGAPADRSEPYSAARPEWYFLFLFQLLKYFKGESSIVASHMLPGLVFFVLLLMPFIGRWKLGHRFNIGFICCVLLGAALLTAMAKVEDNNNPEFTSADKFATRAGDRSVVLAKGLGVTTEGALALVRNDPGIQGARIFSRNCASCHRYRGHDGKFAKIMETVDGELVEAKPTGVDLGTAGSREWTASVLTNFREHFAALKNTQGEAAQVEVAGILKTGSMAEWSAGEDDGGLLRKKENERSLMALVEYIAYQSQRKDLEPFDQQLVEEGRKIFHTGKLAAGTFSQKCVDCHLMHGVGEKPYEDPEGGPRLTGYMGKKWLKEFISDPSRFYTGQEHQLMPAFKGRLSEKELDMLVGWLVNDYYKASSADE